MGLAVESITDTAARAGRFYHPFPLRIGGKTRIIDNPAGILRVVQDRIQERLLHPLHFPPYLHGGVPGRSTVSNAQAHLGQKVVVKADIKNFFPTITHDQVFHVWRHTLACSPQISRLLTQLTTYRGLLPQGAPTSTSLANLVLHDVGGSEIGKISGLLGVAYTTFVDDLTFSGERARGVLNPTVQILRTAGYRLPHRKIKLLGPRDAKAVTGVGVGPGKLSVSKDKLSKLRSALHQLSLSKSGSPAWEAARRSARGLIAYIAAIDKNLAQRLTRQLAAIDMR